MTRGGSSLADTDLFKIHLDGELVGSVAPGTYLLLEVSPNNHQVAVFTEENQDALTLSVNAGSNYFVEVFGKWGIWHTRAGLRELTKAQGETAVRSAKLAERMPGLRDLVGSTGTLVPPTLPAQTPTEISEQPASSHEERGNQTLRIRLSYILRADGIFQAETDQPWFRVDADVEGGHVLAYYDFRLASARVPLDACWLDEIMVAQCHGAPGGVVMVFEVDGHNLRKPTDQ